jgi:hypothetical protein
MARAEPASVITCFANGHTTQVSADTQHDEPFGLLHSRVIALGITEGLPVGALGLLDLVGGAMSDEDWLASPLDDDVFSFGDGSQVNLDLGHGKNVGRRGHGLQEASDAGFCYSGGDDTHGANDKVRECTVAALVLGTVMAEIRDLRSIFYDNGSVDETLLDKSGGRY